MSGHTRLQHAANNQQDLLRQAHEWITPPEHANEPFIGDRALIVPWDLDWIRKAAKFAASRAKRRYGTLQYANDDPYDLALSEIGLTVAADPEIPFWEAINIAMDHIWDTAHKGRRDQGLSSRFNHAPRFWKYWDADLFGSRTWPADACIDKMAVLQVFDALPTRHQQTLLQIAFSDTLVEAAQAAGVENLHSFRERVRAARRAAFELWFDFESPPPPRKTGGRGETVKKEERTHCKQGHALEGPNIIWYRPKKGNTIMICRTCKNASNQRVKARKKAREGDPK